MNEFMNTFPSREEAQVTLANWRQPPFNRWGFQHVREIIPTVNIQSVFEEQWQLPSVNSAIMKDLPFSDSKGGIIEFEQFLDITYTDAFVLIHQGQTVLEHYANGMDDSTPHILMSVSKSMLGLLAGVLVAEGMLNRDAEIAQYVPEIQESAFAEATVNDLLDMRTGVHFEEDYQALSGAIIEYRKATNWNPIGRNDDPTDLRTFLPTMKARQGAHGGSFNYISPCTDLLGWVIERAASRRYADLFSELIWKPMGASNSAYITVDRLGAPRAAGGMCMTAMDLARVGQLIVEGGCRDQKRILPKEWLEDIVTSGDSDAWVDGSFRQYWPGRDMHYRSKWYVERGPKPLLSAFGIHGQHLFVDCENAIVLAKFSSGPMPIDPDQILITSLAFDTIQNGLTG